MQKKYAKYAENHILHIVLCKYIMMRTVAAPHFAATDGIKGQRLLLVVHTHTLLALMNFSQKAGTLLWG